MRNAETIESIEMLHQVPTAKHCVSEPKPIQQPNAVNKVREGDDLIGKYNLVSVDIDEADRVTLSKANEFVNFFKLRLFQFLMRRNRHANIVNMPHAIAGGFLSDSYMRAQAAASTAACTSKDIDVFMQVETEVFKGLDIETFMRELKEEIQSQSARNRIYSLIEITKYERNNTYDFISIPYIFKIEIPGLPKMEIILSESLERIFDFDISIRHLFNFYGEEEVYAAPIAIQDIEEKQLTVVSPLTPKSTLARLFYFQKRYGFGITEHSYHILAWAFEEKCFIAQEVYDYVLEVEKFKNDANLRAHIFANVLAFCEKFKGDGGFFGDFDTEFPYHELFKPIYRHIVNHHLHDVLFTRTFPYGFISRFSKYIFSEHGGDILDEHSEEYQEALNNCKPGWVCDLYMEHEADDPYVENIVPEDVKEYVEIENLRKLSDVIRSMQLTEEFRQKYFTDAFLSEMYQPRPLNIVLPAYAHSSDIPRFLREGPMNVADFPF